MGSPWSSLGTGARLGIPAAAICAIIIARIFDKAHRISARIADDKCDADLEPHLYCEYPFPFGQTADLKVR
jgi:hypothetical protein